MDPRGDGTRILAFGRELPGRGPQVSRMSADFLRMKSAAIGEVCGLSGTPSLTGAPARGLARPAALMIAPAPFTVGEVWHPSGAVFRSDGILWRRTRSAAASRGPCPGEIRRPAGRRATLRHPLQASPVQRILFPFRAGRFQAIRSAAGEWLGSRRSTAPSNWRAIAAWPRPSRACATRNRAVVCWRNWRSSSTRR